MKVTPRRRWGETVRDVPRSGRCCSARASPRAAAVRGAREQVAPVRGARHGQVYEPPAASSLYAPSNARVSFDAARISSIAAPLLTRGIFLWTVHDGPAYASSPFIPPD